MGYVAIAKNGQYLKIYQSNFIGEYMKDKSYILAQRIVEYGVLGLLGIAIILLCTDANAQEVSIRNKCASIAESSPDYWKCYNATQSADNQHRLFMVEKLAKVAKKKRIKLPKKIIMRDAICTRHECNYPTYLKGNKLYWAVSSSCDEQHIEQAIEVLTK